MLMMSHVLYPVVPKFGFRNVKGLLTLAAFVGTVIAAFTIPALFFFPALLAYAAYGVLKAAVLGFFERLPTGTCSWIRRRPMRRMPSYGRSITMSWLRRGGSGGRAGVIGARRGRTIEGSLRSQEGGAWRPRRRARSARRRARPSASQRAPSAQRRAFGPQEGSLRSQEGSAFGLASGDGSVWGN
jgi:hypothetical protein